MMESGNRLVEAAVVISTLDSAIEAYYDHSSEVALEVAQEGKHMTTYLGARLSPCHRSADA
jgi:hypothetical protein